MRSILGLQNAPAYQAAVSMHAMVLLTGGFLLGMSFAKADPLPLFSNIVYSADGSSPPPEDSLGVYDSTLNIAGIAGMPDAITVSIPRPGGVVSATVHLESMIRREGFTERDPVGCGSDAPPPGACDIIPYPGLPANQFSYTWTGQGNGYDLRLTVHQGYVVGVLAGPGNRFEIRWNTLKELRLDYFRLDDSIAESGGLELNDSASATVVSEVPVMSAAAAQAATVARIEPKTPAGAGTTGLDLLVLVTEEARRQAGGNPSDCRDMTGAMAFIHQNINSINTGFQRSQIPAQVGVVTVTRLNGFTLIPYNGNPANTRQNLRNIQQSNNIRAFRDVVGADVVTTLTDTQTNLGPCGVAYIQRPDCGGNAPGCGAGILFSNFTHFLETVQCSAVDITVHELGHVLGAEHDKDHTNATTSTASFPYSFGYGYRAIGTGFETIMAQRFYSQPNYYPTRLLQFSNPNLMYNGQPTGIANQFDNARTLTNLIPGTAAFRTRPNLVFASGFDEQNACPGVVY